MGFTDDRRRIWAGGLAGSEIYVFDIATDPARPKLVQDDQGSRQAGPATSARTRTTRCRAACSSRRSPTRRTRAASPAWRSTTTRATSSPAIRCRSTNGGDGYGYDLAVNPKKNVHAHVELHRLRELHAAARRADQGRGGDEALRQHDGRVGPEGDEAADRSCQCPGAPLEIRWSLNPGDNWAVTAAALTSKLWLVQAGRRRPMAGEGSGDHRRPGEDPPARGHQHHPRRQGTLGQHVHGRHDPLFRSVQPAGAEADLREADRQAGQHDLAELGRQARLHHVLAARQLGQGAAPTTSSSCAGSTGTARS